MIMTIALRFVKSCPQRMNYRRLEESMFDKIPVNGKSRYIAGIAAEGEKEPSAQADRIESAKDKTNGADKVADLRRILLGESG